MKLICWTDSQNPKFNISGLSLHQSWLLWLTAHEHTKFCKIWIFHLGVSLFKFNYWNYQLSHNILIHWDAPVYWITSLFTVEVQHLPWVQCLLNTALFVCPGVCGGRPPHTGPGLQGPGRRLHGGLEAAPPWGQHRHGWQGGAAGRAVRGDRERPHGPLTHFVLLLFDFIVIKQDSLAVG